MNTLADIQGEGKQVVGAGSIHPNGNAYEIVDNEDIGFIGYAELKAIMMAHDKKPKKEVQKKIVSEGTSDDFVSEIKSKVSIESLLSEFGSDTSSNPTNCPFHDSKGGKCLGFKDEVAHCFHCDDSWNIFTLVQQKKNCNFTEALEWLAEREGMGDKLKETRKEWAKKQNPSANLGSKIGNMFDKIAFEVKGLIIGRREDDASELIAKEILASNFIYTTRDDIKSEIWFYDEGIYVPNEKMKIKEISRKIYQEAYTPQRINKVIAKVEADTMIEHDDFFKNESVEDIPVQNGILNIFTRNLQPFTPERIFFNKLPITMTLKQPVQT